MRRSRTVSSIVFLVSLAYGPANDVVRAHDFWLEPAAFETRAGDRVAVRLRVGERFAGQPVPRTNSRIERFSAVGAAGEQPIAGLDGVDPAGVWHPTSEGPHWIVYRSSPRRHQVGAETFERYLVEEGLESARDRRRLRSETNLPGRERYSRSAKALLRVGAGEDGAALVRAPVGLPLEIVPEVDPGRLSPGAELPVRLLFRGSALPAARIEGISAAESSRSVVRRTDADGRAMLPLDRAGVWLVKAVWIEALAGNDEDDWESWWASLIFTVAAARED